MTEVLVGPAVRVPGVVPTDSTAAATPAVELSRRQFGAVLGAGLVVAFGVARLVTETLPTSPEPGDITRGAGVWTSFGTVVVTRAERRARLGDVGAGHAGHAAPVAVPSPQPGNHTWGDVVALELEVHNGTSEPVLVSPGQLRLRIGADGPTVTPHDAGRAAGPVEPGTERMWVSYLAPSHVGELSAEFTDPRLDKALVLDVPRAVRRAGIEGSGS